jgi:hypothetical protein
MVLAYHTLADSEPPTVHENSSAQKPPRKVCFVIAPIGEPDTETRKKSDQVLRHLLNPVLEPKYSVERADKMGRPGIITVQIVQQIFDAELVVADLTDRNPNVYYELAIRHAVQKPAIHIVSRGDQDVPFDVQDMRFVPYDLADPDALDEARGKLRDAVQAIEQGEPVVTPVRIAQILRSLDASENRDVQFRALFESLNAGMSNLQGGIAEIVQDLRQRNNNPIWGFGSPPAGLVGTIVPPASGFNFPTGSQKFAKTLLTGSKAEAIRENREAKETKDQK